MFWFGAIGSYLLLGIGDAPGAAGVAFIVAGFASGVDALVAMLVKPALYRYIGDAPASAVETWAPGRALPHEPSVSAASGASSLPSFSRVTSRTGHPAAAVTSSGNSGSCGLLPLAVPTGHRPHLVHAGVEIRVVTVDGFARL